MSKKTERLALCLALLGLTCSPGVLADDYHYVNAPVGNRAAGMGGAYVGLSDDATGQYYNPAGTVYAQGTELSASMNTFQSTSVVYREVLGGEYDWVRSSDALLPNFFGILRPLGAFKVGISYAVPNSSHEDQDQTFENIPTALGTADQFIINFNNDDDTYLLGPMIAYAVNDRLSVGATLYLHYRHLQRISNIILQYAGDRYWSNEYLELDEYGIKPVLGVMWTPAPRWSLGATVSKVAVLDTEITKRSACLGANASTPPPTALCQPDNYVNYRVITSDERAQYPLRLALGATWFQSENFLLGADVVYHEASGAGAEARESVTNYALGAEYYLSPRWALRGGVYTDFANTPELESGFTAYNQPEHVDMYGVSASLSHYTRNSSLSAGFIYSHGSGKAQIISGSTALQDVEISALSLFLAATYSY